MKRSLTFDVQSCRDLIEKLNRELKRFERTQNREEQSDHALNFALTAWHLIDWVWKARTEGRLEFKDDLARGVENWPGGDGGLKSFREYLLHRCGLLAYCEVVAIAAKHADVDPRDWRPDIEITASAAAIFNSDLEKVGKGWKWKIAHNGSRLDAVQLFRIILDFWTRLIYEETIER